MAKHDTTIYDMIGGKMVKGNEPTNPASHNFLIVCKYGDWSGFRSLADCVSQFAELEEKEASRPGRLYRVVER